MPKRFLDKTKPRVRLTTKAAAPWLLAVIIALQSGCVTVPEAPPPHYQATLGRVAVVAIEQVPRMNFKGFAHSRGEAAGIGAGRTFGSCISGSNGEGILLGLIVCPVAAAVGGVAGAVAAPGAGKAQANEATLSTALAAETIQESLRNQVVAAAHANGTSLVSSPPESMQAATRLRDYRSLAAAGVDTVLEVALTKVGTEDGGVDPPLLLYMEAHARLVRTSDNSEVFSADYIYQGERLKLSEWSANHAEQLRRALRTGYASLGSRIYDNVFLLYPFPDHKVHSTGFLALAFGLAPIYPTLRGAKLTGDPFMWTKVESLQPTLRWQGFPRATDVTVSPEEMGRVKNVRYDLVIARVHDLAPAEIVYRREGLSDTVHTVETPLSPATRYFWTVRARFELDGRQRVTEWGSTDRQHEQLTAPSQFSYRFKTP